MIRDWRELEGLVEFHPEGPFPRIDFVGRDQIRDRGGVWGQALYAWTMNAWCQNKYLQRHEFPLIAITQEHFEVRANYQFSPEDLLLLRDICYDFTAHSMGVDDFPLTRRVYIYSKTRLMGTYFDLMEKKHFPEKFTWTDHRDGTQHAFKHPLPEGHFFFSFEGGPWLSWDQFQAEAKSKGWPQIWLDSNQNT